MRSTFDPDENGGVVGADGVGGDADVAAVVGQGDVLDAEPDCDATTGGLGGDVDDDARRRRRQVGLGAAGRVETSPRDVGTRPTPANAVQLQRVALHQVPRLLHPHHHRNHCQRTSPPLPSTRGRVNDE